MYCLCTCVCVFVCACARLTVSIDRFYHLSNARLVTSIAPKLDRLSLSLSLFAPLLVLLSPRRMSDGDGEAAREDALREGEAEETQAALKALAADAEASEGMRELADELSLVQLSVDSASSSKRPQPKYGRMPHRSTVGHWGRRRAGAGGGEGREREGARKGGWLRLAEAG